MNIKVKRIIHIVLFLMANIFFITAAVEAINVRGTIASFMNIFYIPFVIIGLLIIDPIWLAKIIKMDKQALHQNPNNQSIVDKEYLEQENAIVTPDGVVHEKKNRNQSP